MQIENGLYYYPKPAIQYPCKGITNVWDDHSVAIIIMREGIFYFVKRWTA